ARAIERARVRPGAPPSGSRRAHAPLARRAPRDPAVGAPPPRALGRGGLSPWPLPRTDPPGGADPDRCGLVRRDDLDPPVSPAETRRGRARGAGTLRRIAVRPRAGRRLRRGVGRG